MTTREVDKPKPKGSGRKAAVKAAGKAGAMVMAGSPIEHGAQSSANDLGQVAAGPEKTGKGLGKAGKLASRRAHRGGR